MLVNARVRAAAGSRDEALNLLDELLARQAKSVKALQLKAEILAGMGRNEEVIDLLQRILQLDPNVYEARSLLLREALAKNRIDDATKLVESIPEKMAKRPQGRFPQAQLALAKGDAAKARELGQPLLKVMPNYVPLLRCWREPTSNWVRSRTPKTCWGRPSSGCRKTEPASSVRQSAVAGAPAGPRT